MREFRKRPRNQRNEVLGMKRSLTVIALSAVCLSAASALALPAFAAEASWKTENGKRYYYDANGKKATGTVTIDGIAYVFAPNGVQQLGWQTVDGKRYFYNKKGEAVFGWVEWRGETYYVTKEDGKRTGKVTTGKRTLDFDEYGVCSKWQLTADGEWVYEDAYGEMLIDGELYLFTDGGMLKTGWQTAATDGITRYYDPKSHGILAGWITEEDGKQFYADPDKGKVSGFITDADGKRFYVDPEKGALTGWNVINGQQYKMLDTGEIYTGLYTASGKTYLFGDDGVMVTGFADTKDGRRYFGEGGVMVTGHTEIGNDTYYFNNEGVMQTGFQNITVDDGRTMRCFFDADGKRRTGLITVGDKKYYLNPDGSITVEPTVIDGKKYLFDPDGNMIKGWYTADSGKKYYAGADGALVSGWQTIDGKKYYFDENCALATEPHVIDGKTYLITSEGTPMTGWYTAPNGSKYYAGADGLAVTGLQTIGTAKYYFDANCVMTTGWQTIGNAKYYFDSNGVMATAPTVIGDKTYLFNADGTAATGLYTAANGKKYYADANGIAQIGWQELPNQSSYFGADGVMVVSATVDGCTIDANGSARNNRAKKFDEVIANSAKTVNGVYQSFCAKYKYREIEVARTTDQLLNAGWQTLIDTCINRNGGVCYHLASALDFTFKRAGFTSRVVYAWHGSHHYWCQVLIDGTWWNYDPTYGMNRCHITLAQQNQADIDNKRPGYTLRGYVNATYDHKGALVSATYTPI